jgi:hypothetical protein
MYKEINYKRFILITVALFLIGLFVRVAIAYIFFGAYDMESWMVDTKILLQDKNVYVETRRYHYAPVLLWVLHAMGLLSKQFNLPMHFAIKLPLIATDILIYGILLAATYNLNLKPREKILIPTLYFLNPVPIILTSFQGQFCNMSLLFVLLAWYIFRFYPKYTYPLTTFLMSFSVAVKHFTIMLAPIFALSFKKIWKKIVFLIASPMIFILTLLPNFMLVPERVYKYVLSYNLGGGYWGWSGIVCRILLFFGLDLEKFSWFRYIGYFNYFLYIGIFILSLYLVKRFKLLDNIIIVFLVFYVFTTQIAPQYSIWILPFAVLRRNIYFYLYTVVCTIHLLAFEYCHYHWWQKIPFVGIIPNLIPETFIIFRYLLWCICVLWLISIFRWRSLKLLSENTDI